MALSLEFNFLAEGGGRGSGVIQRGMSILDRCVKPAHTQGSRLALSCPQQLGADFGAIFLKSNRKSGQSQFHHELLSSSFSLISEESSITWDKMSRQSLKNRVILDSEELKGLLRNESWEMKRKLVYRTWQILRMGWSSRVNWWDLSSDLEHHLQGSAMEMLQVRLGKKSEDPRYEKKTKTMFPSFLCCYTLCGIVSQVVLGLQYPFFASISEVLRISECMNWMQE